jgi:hypothetical protein
MTLNDLRARLRQEFGREPTTQEVQTERMLRRPASEMKRLVRLDWIGRTRESKINQ